MVSIWICIFTLLLKLRYLVEALTLIKGANPGSGVNFYRDYQKNTLLTPVKDLVFNFAPRDCTKAPMNSTCIVDPLFTDPNLACQTLDHPSCDPTYPYRYFDGKCADLLFPTVGMSKVCFLRFLAPLYDGYDGIRKAMSGAPLPEPRNISVKIFKNCRRQDEEKVTFLYVLFGQVIAHDMVRAVRPFKINCCAPENSNKSECLPIKVSPDDPFYSRYSKTCIDFHRSEECKYCPTATRAQTNGATAGLDLSFVYGENEEKAKKLRAFNGTGELKNSTGCLPIVGVDKEDEFCRKGEERLCLLNGDPRVNQHASLGSSQTVWMREHNRIAKKLKELNPDWKEEEIFQESRKINIAEYQCIAYKHFFPPLLSDRVMKQFKIYIEDGSAGTNYNQDVVLEVWNEFAVCAFRLHSMVTSLVGTGKLRLKDTYSNPRLIRQGKTSTLLKGASNVSMEMYDSCVIDDLSKYLYKKLQDLVSINIQRGRDHGLAPYVEAVRFCSGESMKVENFDNLWELGLMKKKNANRLRDIYEDVRDIDLWVGMNLEIHLSGSLLGPTAVCFIAKQMYFTMHGDPLFFNHQGPIASFTPEQRTELKKCSYARVLCDTTNIKSIAKNPFFLPSDQNPEVKCEEIPKINLSIFKGSDKLVKPETPNLAPDASNLNGGLLV